MWWRLRTAATGSENRGRRTAACQVSPAAGRSCVQGDALLDNTSRQGWRNLVTRGGAQGVRFPADDDDDRETNARERPIRRPCARLLAFTQRLCRRDAGGPRNSTPEGRRQRGGGRNVARLPSRSLNPSQGLRTRVCSSRDRCRTVGTGFPAPRVSPDQINLRRSDPPSRRAPSPRLSVRPPPAAGPRGRGRRGEKTAATGSRSSPGRRARRRTAPRRRRSRS